jgi:hypothetical protein
MSGGEMSPISVMQLKSASEECSLYAWFRAYRSKVRLTTHPQAGLAVSFQVKVRHINEHMQQQRPQQRCVSVHEAKKEK